MKKIFLIFTMLISSYVSAGILIEPQLGYIFSSKFNSDATLVSGATTIAGNLNYKSTAVEFGARLGYQMLGVMGGLNFGKISGTTIDNNSNGDKSDYKGTNLGVFVGYNAPLFIRGWVAYNFSSKFDDAKGKSTELGLGLTSIPFLSINFIYRMYNITEVTDTGVTYSATGLKPKEMELAISAPFNLF